MKKFSLGPIFPQIYFEKFGNKSINTPNGFIQNNFVYLDLEDLNLINDLGHILDFYREIEFEGKSLNLIVYYVINFAEWIPIRGFLENRNINSDYYKRKIRYKKIGDLFELRLINKKCNYNSNKYHTLIQDAIYICCEKYNLSESIVKKLFSKISS